MRVTKSDLLLDGWHALYINNESLWAHPDHSSGLCVRFSEAAKALQERKGK